MEMMGYLADCNNNILQAINETEVSNLALKQLQRLMHQSKSLVMLDLN
jgi:hypothetical protein